MASRCLLLFFVFLSLTGLSEEGCNDHFSKEHWNGTNMTDMISLENANSTEKILHCTIWKNTNQELFSKISMDCLDPSLNQVCRDTTKGKHKIRVFHFRCLYAKLHHVNYSIETPQKTIFEDCQNFSSEINTLQQLWNSLDNDGTSTGATSVSPPITSTLCSTTTITTSTPTTSTSRRITTMTSSTTTMSSLLGTNTSTTSLTNTSTSGRTTTLTSPPTPLTLTQTTTSTTSTPTISTLRNTTSLTSSTTTSTSPRTTMSTTTTLKSSTTTTSTRSPPTTSKSFLTTQSRAKGKAQLSNTATRQSPTDSNPCRPCSFQSVPHVSQRTETSTHTWNQTSILVLLALSITGNLMQGLNSFLQKRNLNMNKQTSPECICLNPDTTVADKSPEKTLSYSNESVH